LIERALFLEYLSRKRNSKPKQDLLKSNIQLKWVADKEHSREVLLVK